MGYDFEVEHILERAMSKFENYDVKRKPYNIRCRCHICGDSRTDRRQARLNAYYYKDALRLNCYNCGYQSSAIYYLRNFHPYEYGIYSDNKREEWLRSMKREHEASNLPKSLSLEDQLLGIQTHQEEVKDDLITEIEPSGPIYPTSLPYCMRLDEIDEDHAIVKYVKDRMIPRNKWHRLFFTTKFIELANYASPGMYPRVYPEPRLVIPIYNVDGGIESFQGRALSDKARDKYITVKFDESATKIYGLDTVDPNSTAYFLEGQIDSLFIDNGMAITGGAISTHDLNTVYSGDRAFIMDDESRHPDTIQRIEKLLASGEKIVLFDKVNWKGKDINQYIQNGISVKDINKYIRENTIGGVVAQSRFIDWKNVDTTRIKNERKDRYRNDHKSKLLQEMYEKLKK